MNHASIRQLPQSRLKEIRVPYPVSIQNDHITSKTGATAVIPPRAHPQPVEIMSPLAEVAEKGLFVMATDEIFAIDSSGLNSPIAVLSKTDRAKIKPALDKVTGEYY